MVIFVVGIQEGGQVTESVRDDHLLEKTPDDAKKSLIEILHFDRLPCEQSIRCVRISRNRAFHDLREETQKQSHLSEAALSGISLPIDICHISHCFQGIERDSHREHDSRHRQLHSDLSEQYVGILRDEIIIIHIEQNAQQNKDSQPEYSDSFLLKVLFDRFFLFSIRTFRLFLLALLSDLVHPQADPPCKGRCCDQKKYKVLAERNIQNVTGGKKNTPPCFARYQLVYDQNDRKKYQQVHICVYGHLNQFS